MRKAIRPFQLCVVAVLIPSTSPSCHPGKFQRKGGARREGGSKLGPVSRIHLETACLLNSTNFLLPFFCSPQLDEAHFWNSRAGTNQVHIPLLQREKGMSGGFIKEERLFHLVRGKNEARRGSFALTGGYLVNSSIRFCNFLIGFRYPEVFFHPENICHSFFGVLAAQAETHSDRTNE